MGDDVTVEVENIGGIDNAVETLAPGATILSGANATNRTSFLRALATGLGGSQATLQSGAEEGHITIEIGGEEYTTTVDDAGGFTHPSDYPFTADTDTVAPFSWLFVDNEIRKAFRNNDTSQLASIAMKPVDTAQIESEVDSLKQQRDALDEEIGELEAQHDRRVEIESTIQSLIDERDELTEQIEEQREAVAEAEEKSQESVESDYEDEISELTDEKGELSSSINRDERKLERSKSSLAEAEDDLESLREEYSTVQDRLDEIDVSPETVRGERRDIQQQLDETNELIESLDTVIQFNRDVLSGDISGVQDVLQGESQTSAADPLAGLSSPDDTAVDGEFECWTCGSSTSRDAVEGQLSVLKNQRKELSAQQSELESELSDLQKQERKHESLVDRLESLQSKEQELERVCEEYTEQIDDLETEIAENRKRHDELTDEIAALREKVEEEDESGDSTELLDKQLELQELENERADIEEEIATARDEMEEAEKAGERIETVRERREETAERITSLIDRVDEREEEIVERFNNHMDDLITLLNYENLSRVAITRKKRNGETHFDLTITREAEDGSGFIDPEGIQTLSESEGEIVAISFALAGYLAHDLQDEMPFLLFDSVEMVDGERLDRLFDYFSDAAEYMVAALLEDDAAYITSVDATVVEFGEAALAGT